jgi:DNA-binding GntR family transcriptional regulator
LVSFAGSTKAPALRALRTIRARGPLVEQVYRSLKDAIITGRIAPGAWLYETALTQALGVSRTPLREAFNRLKSDGLIRVIPHRGAFVVELEDRDIDNLLEAREVIETAFFDRAARGLAPHVLRQVRRELEQAHRLFAAAGNPAARRKALQHYLRVDRALHDRLIEASGNGYWVKLYFDLRERIELCGYQVSQLPHRFERIVREHLEMIDALLAGDLGRAHRCLKAHIRNVQQGVHEYRRLNERPGTGRHAADPHRPEAPGARPPQGAR